jgi:hypothetical protein
VRISSYFLFVFAKAPDDFSSFNWAGSSILKIWSFLLDWKMLRSSRIEKINKSGMEAALNKVFNQLGNSIEDD